MEDTDKTCFVIQAFDGGKYDKRYEEVYKKAILAAGLRPVRADQVLGTRPIIETIEDEISKSDAVLADISESNENVFLELGYALANFKPAVIICDRGSRPQLPFDIRHRPVIFYDSDSPSSFEKLSRAIKLNLAEEVSKGKRIKQANVAKTGGSVSTEDYENAALGIILSYSHTSLDGVSSYLVSREFDQLNYVAATLGIAIGDLVDKGLIEEVELFDERDSEKFKGYKLTDAGMRYVLDNRDVFVAKREAPILLADDDIPF